MSSNDVEPMSPTATSEDGMTKEEREVIKIPSRKAQKAASKKAKSKKEETPVLPTVVKKRAPRAKVVKPAEEQIPAVISQPEIPKEVVASKPSKWNDSSLDLFRNEINEMKTKGFSQVQTMAQEIENLKKMLQSQPVKSSHPDYEELRNEVKTLKEYHERKKSPMHSLGETQQELLKKMRGY